MTTTEMRERARKWRNCGLETDALMVEALAGLYEQAQCDHGPLNHPGVTMCRQCIAVARVEALPP